MPIEIFGNLNFYRVCGDFVHFAAFFILLIKIWFSKSGCKGVSGKSQVLYAMVFVTRYVDLFLNIKWISMYNTVFKLIYISLALFTVASIYCDRNKNYSSKRDNYGIFGWIAIALVLSFYYNHVYSVMEFSEISWAFSICLEAIVILPQMHLSQKSTESDNWIASYLFALASYRGFYILNWIFRYQVEGHYNVLQMTAGVAQMMFYIDHFLKMRAKHQEIQEQEGHVTGFSALKNVQPVGLGEHNEKANGLPNCAISMHPVVEDKKMLIA